jgi:hypothetical protein
MFGGLFVTLWRLINLSGMIAASSAKEVRLLYQHLSNIK